MHGQQLSLADILWKDSVCQILNFVRPTTVNQIFSNEILDPRFVWTNNIFGPKNKKVFYPKFCLGCKIKEPKTFWNPKFFWTSNFHPQTKMHLRMELDYLLLFSILNPKVLFLTISLSLPPYWCNVDDHINVDKWCFAD